MSASRAFSKSASRVLLVVPTSWKQSAASFHDLGNPERAADLDELTPRNENLFSQSKCVQNEQQRSCIVVADGSSFAAQESDHPLFEELIAVPSLTFLEIELEIGIAGGDLEGLFRKRPGHGSPANIGVNDDPCGIDYTP